MDYIALLTWSMLHHPHCCYYYTAVYCCLLLHVYIHSYGLMATLLHAAKPTKQPASEIVSQRASWFGRCASDINRIIDVVTLLCLCQQPCQVAAATKQQKHQQQQGSAFEQRSLQGRLPLLPTPRLLFTVMQLTFSTLVTSSCCCY